MTALEFAEVVRNLSATVHRLGLKTPAFRSPPRDPSALRTVRWHNNGCVVSVRMKDRPDDDVVDDMVLGVLVANGLGADDPRADEIARSAINGAPGPISAQEVEARAFAEAPVVPEEKP